MSIDNSVLPFTAQLIGEAAFAAYGEILDNKLERRRRDFAVPFSRGALGAELEPRLWVNRLARHHGSPVLIDVMESHPHSAQTFVPLQPGRCLVVVALPDAHGKPALDTLRAFVTRGGQGVSYRPGIWHYAFTSLDCPNEVVVIMGSSGHRDDTVIEQLTQHVTVAF